jgi:hypothetical protein
MRRHRKIALVGAGAAGVLAIGLSVPAFAATNDSPAPSPSSSASSATMPSKPAPSGGSSSGSASSGSASSAQKDWRKDWKDAAKDRQDKLSAGLAKELGIDQKKVSDALTKVQKQLAGDAKTKRADALKDRLAKAVKAGKLTQAQADAIVAAAQKGVLPAGGWGQHGSRAHAGTQQK